MLSRIYSPSKNEEGFTLIELLIVVIIIGILAAIALPIFLNQQKAAADASVQSDVRNTVDNIATWLVKNSGTAEANTGAWKSATDAGKPVVSGSNTVGVNIASDGSYQVCGYTSAGNLYKTASAAYTYDSTSGKFQSGTCVSGSDTGGSASGTQAQALVSGTIDFESTPTGAIAGSYGTGSGYGNVVTNNAHNGTHSFASVSGGGVYYNFTTPLPAGTYTVSAYVYGQNSPTGTSIYATNSSGAIGSYPSYSTNNGTFTTNTWVKVSYTFTTATPVTSVNVGGGQSNYIDDINVTQTS